jgi:glycosyltransferase involved in cell wall biosynthesis
MTPTVVHIANFSPSYGGNFAASLKALSGPCKNMGLRLVLVFLEDAQKYTWCSDLVTAGCEVRFIPGSRGLRRDAKAILALIEEENPAIIHTHFMHFDIPAWMAIRSQPSGRRPRLIWHAHGTLRVNPGWMRSLKDCIKYRWMGRSVWTIAVLEDVRRELVAAGTPENRVRTIRNGIDMARATTAVRTPQQVRSELQIADQAQWLFMLGWEPIRKGVDLALDAVGRLTQEGQNIVLGVVGTDQLRQYLNERGADPACPWLRVIAPTEDIAALFQTAAMFLSPSRNEGLPYAVVEALANEIPVALSDIPSVAWAHDCQAASFFSDGDSHGLEQAIRERLNWSADERQKRTRQSREFVQREFDVKLWAQEIARFYEEILRT